MLQRYITDLLGGEKYVSCSAVLPSLHHLLWSMDVSDVDPAYIAHFKNTFTKDLNKRKEHEPGLVKSSLSFRPPF